MLKVGLTGGIGAGKSAVASLLKAHGAILIDADVVAREVVAPGTEGLSELVDLFGQDILGEDGALDRARMAERVFGDQTARRRLEGVIHPRVRSRTAELIDAAPPDAIVVNDVPLLVEVGLAASFDLVMVVESPMDIRVRRLIARGMTAAQAEARISAQAPDEVRRAAADILIDNSGSYAELRRKINRIWDQRLVPAAAAQPR